MRANIRRKAGLPFELRVLESLLADTVHFFEAKGARLEFLMDSVLSEVNSSAQVPEFASAVRPKQELRAIDVNLALNENQSEAYGHDSVGKVVFVGITH